jgi:2-polyprenyl-6-methoxyphenol hydroxylase-like FAD-dependent oxidoreductase
MADASERNAADALIVGAGPVGLTAAIALTMHGVRCRIVDRNAARTDKSKALVLWSRSLELLDDLGGAAPFVDAGTRGHGASLYAGAKRLVHATFDDLDSPYPYVLMIPQSDTERILEERLASLGVTVERETEVTSVRPSADGVETRIAHRDGSVETARFPWLVACDGAHSTVRHELGLEFAGEVEPNDWILADAHIDGALPDDEITLYWHERGVIVFFPIVGGRFRMIADVGLAHGLDHPPDPTLEQVQQVLEERGPGGLRLHDPVWLSGFRIHERKLKNYRHGRVLLAGDAAHIHSPAGGQGMNTGMQDAYNLAWKLALVHQGRARDALLDSYDVERSAVGEVVLRNAAAMTRVATLRNPLAQALRNHLVPVIASLGFVQDRFKATLSEITIEYGGSPICDEHRGGLAAHAWLLGGGVAPGGRALDAPLVDPATGATTSLYAALVGRPHVLLLLTGVEIDATAPDRLLAIARTVRARFGGDVESILVAPERIAGGVASPGVRELLDPDRALHRRYAATTACLYLIRPDGYVGFRSLPAETAPLLAHLERYLVPHGSTS